MPRLNPETIARRRAELIDAAIGVLARRPGASMVEIASEAGIARATLYRHFPTREALVHALCIEALDRVDAACAELATAPTYAAALRGMLHAVIPLGAEMYFLAGEGAAYDDPEVAARIEVQLDQTRQMAEWGQSTGEVRRDMPAAWIASLVDGLVWSGWTALARGVGTPTEIADLAFDSIWRGLAAPPEEAR